jgi:hypothetical protein
MKQWTESVNKVEKMIESCTNVIEEPDIDKESKRLAVMVKNDLRDLLIMLAPKNDSIKKRIRT